jgi:hypothetical protein
MKTITVSDEVYEFLKSCQEELKTQDNRMTANPIYGFREVKEIPSYNQDYTKYLNKNHDTEISDTKDDDYLLNIATHLLERFDYDMRHLNENIINCEKDEIEYREQKEDESKKDYDLYLKNTIKNYLENEHWLDDFLEEAFDINTYHYEEMQVMYESSVSLFESDMEEHLQLNRHNMSSKCKTYVYSNYRTPKMNKLRNTLLKDLMF